MFQALALCQSSDDGIVLKKLALKLLWWPIYITDQILTLGYKSVVLIIRIQILAVVLCQNLALKVYQDS